MLLCTEFVATVTRCAGVSSCLFCLAESFASNLSMARCDSCPANSRALQPGAERLDQCVCREEYYGPPGLACTRSCGVAV